VAGRVVLWAAVILVAGRGLVSLFAGPASGSPAPKPAVVGERYPSAAAEAFAARFTTDYLTYDATDPAGWAARTAAYGLDDLSGGWDGQGTQTVTSVVPAGVESTSSRSGVVTVAARTGSGWLHLAVPVASTRTGLALAARPVFVAAPTAGKAPGTGSGEVDTAAAEAVRPTLEAFLTAYANGDQAVIAALSADRVDLPPLEGDRFTLAAVDAVTVPKTKPGQDRTALVSVRWADHTSGAALGQTYQLGLTRSGERWLVTSLGAASPNANPNPVKEK
jgi:hypothetical protein